MPIALNALRHRGGRALLLGVAIAAIGSCSNNPPATNWPQNWSPQQQSDWYAATQGSRLMPLAWMKALEQPDSNAPFLADDNIARYRLLPGRTGGLPVGFAVDDSDDSKLSVTKLRWFDGQPAKEKWVGLNCSACHTAQLSFQGHEVRVDGGPALFDYQSFIEALDASLRATLAGASGGTPEAAAKWRRFGAAVLGPSRDTDANRVLLQGALGQLLGWEDRIEKVNKTPLRYGYGRVDAFGHIFNKVSLFTGAPNPMPNPADAPVSYPFLWDIYRHDKLQWNGIVSNLRIAPPGDPNFVDFGALGRNTGEVIGVFGDVVVRQTSSDVDRLGGYTSSIQAANLMRLEKQLSTLRAPAWPAASFGPTGDTGAGKAVFEAHCQSCHKPQPGTAPYKVTMMPLVKDAPNTTDPWMACNAITYASATGRLKGTPVAYLGNGPKYADQGQIADMLATTVKGTMAGQKLNIVSESLKVFLGVDRPPRVVIEELPDLHPMILDACYASGSALMAYKARPLDGIWATAPYLHNGSVSSLYELLLPPARRMRSFPMGTREYDPVHVGYSVKADAAGNSFTYDTTKRGNSNMGHDYGASQLTEPQRLALLAYLKSL